MMNVKLGVWLLEKLPFLGSAVTWLKNKKRLFIEYVLLACVVAIGGLALGLWLTKKELKSDLSDKQTQLDSVKGQVVGLKLTNDIQAQTITGLKNARQTDSETLAALFLELERVSKGDKSVRERLAKLEQSNEAVRNFRNMPVPPELGCLLEPRACKDGKPTNASR